MTRPAEPSRTARTRVAALRGGLVAVLVAGVLAIAPTAHATPLDPGGNLADLKAALASCLGTLATPFEVTLTAALGDADTELVVNCDARIDLAGHDLTVRNVIVSSGKSLQVTDTTPVAPGTDPNLNAGTLTADATNVNSTAGIQTSGATLTTSGTAQLIATGGYRGAGIGGGENGSGGTTSSLGASTITAFGGYSAAAIGGGFDGDGGSTTSNDTSTITATGSDFGAGIGGGEGGAGGTTASNDTSTITATGGASGAGIGGGNGGPPGTTSSNGDSTITATGGASGAGIGGGKFGPGGITTSNDTSDIIATGGILGAGIGGGDSSAGGLNTATSNGASTITATGGYGAAGVGGGYGGTGGTTTSNDTSTITATGGGNAAGIGGGFNGAGGNTTTNDTSTITATGGANAAGIGGGMSGSGGTTSVAGGSTMIATGSGGSAVGVGSSATPAVGTFLHVTEGTLKLGSDLVVPDATGAPEVEIATHGVITRTTSPVSTAAITGTGTIANAGAITLPTDAVAPTLVTDRHYRVTFDTQGGSTAPDAVTVYADTFTHGERTFPPDPTKPGLLFSGWNTAADGTGDTIDADTALPGTSTDGAAVPLTLVAQWADPAADLPALKTALATCTGTPEAPYTVALTADLTDTATELEVLCDARIDLAGHDLTVRNIGIFASLEVTDTTPVAPGPDPHLNAGTLTADASAAFLIAGIDNTSGSLTASGTAQVVAAGAKWGAGIGGFYSQAGGTTTSNDSSTITATGGEHGAGIGGGEGGTGGTTTSNDTSTITATGTPVAPAIGAGMFASDPGFTSITGGSTVNASAGSGSAVGLAADFGPPVAGTFLSVTNGTLRLGSDLHVPDADSDPATAEVSVGADGVIAVLTSPPSTAAITGDGTIDNGGAITLPTDAVDPTLVTDRHYRVTFDTQGGSTAPDAVTVYADTFTHGERTFPPDPTKAGYAFLGWNTAANGSGDTIDADTALPGTSTDGAAVPVTLHARYRPLPSVSITSTAPTDAVVGGPAYVVTTQAGPSTGAVALAASPAGVCTISGSTVSFVGVGPCTVTATQAADADIDEATDSQQFDVGKGPQAITFLSSAPSPAYPGDGYDVVAAGGGGTSPVTFSSGSPTVCAVSGSTVAFVGTGDCAIRADQAGDANYDAAPQAVQHVVVTQVGSSVQVTTPTGIVAGQGTTVSAQVSVEVGAAEGTVQFQVDGTDLGGPVTVDGSGGATSPEYAGGAGDHAVAAIFSPSVPVRVAGSSGTGTLGVGKASTTTAVSVTATALTAVVSASAPGTGTPGGEVQFFVDGSSVGTASLTGGSAGLARTVPAGEHTVAAEYSGDADFTGSSASTARRDPGLRASVTAARPKNARGWFRTPVTVRFTCTTHGSPLVGDCPAPVTLRRDGAGQSVTRTIRAADGGIATTTARVDLDRTPPRVRVSGIRAGGRYFAAPQAGCAAADATSGLARHCTVRVHRRGERATVTATATDRAGNRSTARASYRLVRHTVDGAPYARGAYQVRRGATYTLRVRSTSQPRYLYATPYPGTPQGGEVGFHQVGPHTWALAVTMSMSTSHTRTWYLGILDHGHVIRLTVHLLG